MKVLTLFLVFFTSSGFSNSFDLSEYQAIPANIFHICQTIFRHNLLQTSDYFELVLSRDDSGYNFWFSLSLSARFNLEADLRTDDNSLQDVSLFAEGNMKKLEEELMMHRFIQDTNTNQRFKNKITTEERSDEEISLKTASEKNTSKQISQNRVTLKSNIEDVLEENQEHLGRSEEDSASISLRKAAKTEKHYLSDTEDYLNKKDSEEVQENGIHLFPNLVTSRTTTLTDETSKWEKQEVKLDQTDAKLKTNDPVEDKEEKTAAVISLFEDKRDTKKDYMELAAKQEVKGEGITENLSQKTKETGSHKEIYNLTLPLATLFTHSEIHGTQSQNRSTFLYHQDFVRSMPKVSKTVSSDSKVKLREVEDKHLLHLGTEIQPVTPKSLIDINTDPEVRRSEFITTQAAKPKPAEVRFILKDFKTKEGNYTQKFNKNTPTAKVVHFTPKPSTVLLSGKPTIVTQMENNTIFMVRHNKVSPPQPQGTKPSPRLKRLSTTAPSMSPTKTSSISKNKKPSKEKKRRNDNKTRKPQEGKNKIPPPTLFPYFMDDYCPPMCACYGRVVQCSNKGVEQFPYGIPYNARCILLMNNHINSIQLDLLNEYLSLDFLSLSNNWLTDGAIEGSFEGIPVLKRLYLDRNQLQSVPTDLPVSLEELRLDNNLLETMSEAAWAQCPSLLVLSLSNNNLGNRSGSLPPGALSPLHNLRTLNLEYNQLASVPLELPLSIKEFYLRGNHLQQLSRGVFNGISQMLVLDLSANRLKSKGLVRDSLLNATHLESLNLEGNKLKQVPQNLPNSLKTLNLEGNLISSIKKSSFRNLNNLEHLGLARNAIFKVSTGAFKTLPALHQLDLCHNKLHQVPRQLPEGLHSVALTHNKIESVPGNAFCWGSQSLSLSRLVQVRLEHNLIEMGKLDVRAFRCLRGMQVVHFY